MKETIIAVAISFVSFGFCHATEPTNPFGSAFELTPPDAIKKLPPLSKQYKDRSRIYMKARYSKMPEGVFRSDIIRGAYSVSQFISLGGNYWVEAFQQSDGTCVPMLFKKVAQTADSIVLQDCDNTAKSVEIFKSGKCTLTLKARIGNLQPCVAKPLYQLKWYKN